TCGGHRDPRQSPTATMSSGAISSARSSATSGSSTIASAARSGARLQSTAPAPSSPAAARRQASAKGILGALSPWPSSNGGNCGPARIARATLELAQVELRLDDVIEIGAGGGQYHFHLERTAAHALVAYHPLDLPLRGHAHLLQEFAQRHVELVFVHGRSSPF